MRRKARLSLYSVLLLSALSGCGGNSTPPLSGALRVSNGIADSTGLDVALTGIGLPTDFQNVAFDSGTHIADVPEGSYMANFSTTDSGGDSVSFTVNNLAIDQNDVSTVFTYGTVTNNTANGFVAEEALDAPPSGQFVIQFVHAAYAESKTSAGQTLTFFLIAPGSSSTADPVYSTAVMFGNPSPSAAVNSGTYEILVQDSDGATIFDSGSDGIQLPSSASNVFQVAVLDSSQAALYNPGSPGLPGADCPLASLLVLDNNGDSTSYDSAQACPA
jgi:hypothetical protein